MFLFPWSFRVDASLFRNNFKKVMFVNHVGVMYLTQKLLPSLSKSPTARIVDVSSQTHGFVR